MSARVWTLRVLVLTTLVLLCVLARSNVPALALALAWSPNGLFLFASTRGILVLPRALESVHPLEPVLYRRLGVQLVKRIVTTQEWPLLIGFEPLPKPKTREDFFDRTQRSAKGAEICHGATFLLACLVAVWYLVDGRISTAAWIMAFNVALNAYPVMLQRTTRWRVNRSRAFATAAIPSA